MSVVRKQLYYIWKKFSERSSRRKFRNVFYQHDLQRFATCQRIKSAAQMKGEMRALHKYWGCYPFQYYRFDFYKQDCSLTVEEMKTYIPLFFLHHLYFPYSYKDYGVLCEDKLLTYALLKAYDIPQPKLLFCYDHHTFYDGANNPITTAEADASIRGSAAETLFVKPRFGSEGKGIAIFNKKEGLFVNGNSMAFDHTFFIENVSTRNTSGRDATGFFIVQEGLRQHQELSRMYPQSVNTYRIITECMNGQAHVLYCVVRMGSGGRQIDNASAGGIFVRIDLETGALYDRAQAFDQSTSTTHPDTGFEFKGTTMQTWQDVKAFTLEAARKFREIRYLGWDIAVTPEGPSVIEFNNKPDMAGIQDSYGGIRDHWKINPKDWWYQSQYTLKNL